MKFYVIVFERDSTKSYKQFQKELISSPLINGYWHYIKTMYIVGSKYSSSEISKHVRKCFENNKLNKRHIVLSVNLSERQGWLPKEAWEWIKKYSKL